MKAHWNARPCFFTVPTLLVLFGIFFLIADQASAQQAQQEPAYDEVGRILGTQPGAALVEPETGGTDEGDKVCDVDGGDCSGLNNRQTEDQVILGDLGIARFLQDGLGSFQVQKDAPKNSVHIDGTGNLGVGTDTPVGRIHVVAKPDQEDARDIFLLDENGNLELGGLLIEASSMLLKENFTPVETQQVLETLMTLPISTWNYKTDAASVRHMGPMAQDFYAAFGLGTDEAHLAPLDVNGVALSAVQALYETVQAQASRLTTLEQQNADLLQRLDALEALVRADN